MSPSSAHRRNTDGGFTLVEVLIVLVLLGLLAAIVVFAVRGIRADADDSACGFEARILGTAVESYMAEHLSTTLAAADATPDGYERTVMGAGYLRSVSELWDLDVDGELVVAAGSPC